MDFQNTPCFFKWFSCLHLVFKLAHNGFGLGERGDFHHPPAGGLMRRTNF